jgi:hypothetical protein
VTVVRLRNWLLAGLAAIVALLVVIAWVAGGQEPVRVISEPVPLPENAE